MLLATFPAYAEPSAYASRDIEKQNLAAGGFTNIIITIENNVTQALSLQETIPAGWNLTRITDDANSFKASTNEWVWFGVGVEVTKTVVYRLNVPSNTTSGIYYINGNLSNSSGVIAIVASENTINISVQPVADCGPDKFRCENVASPVSFNASSSYDPDGSIVSYVWDFGDGANGTGASPSHKYYTHRWNGTAYQPFTVNLFVTDNGGLANRTSQKVVIWIAGDANGDGKVNILDASVVGLNWGIGDPCADLNNDGKVNIIDASTIGWNWGKTA